MQIDSTQYEEVRDKSTQAIVNVRHRKLGNIRYKAIRMDEASGFQLGSVLKIWTHKAGDEMLNILHIHVNEGSDSVSIDIRYL